jgi:3-oxoacyl-[acyl-carrier-protein] synthase II
MAASSRRAVLTGIGVITPVGKDAATFARSLAERRSGVRKIQAFDPAGLPVQIAGEVPDFDAKEYVDKSQRKGLRMMARTIQLAVAGAQRALDDGAVDKSELDKSRFGVEFGAGLIASELPEVVEASRVSVNCQPGVVDLERWGSHGIENIPPLWMLKYLPNFLACHVSILHDAQGPNNSITESDVASTLALGEAYRILTRDDADFFLVGGAESKINPLSMVRQCLFEPLSRRNDVPEAACRPFDRRRDGMVLGEGAAVYTLEDLEHAQRRGARIYAEVVGFGSAFDRKLDGSGLARAVRAALADAGIDASDVDHVNAHGVATGPSDRWEARGLAEVFGPSRTPLLGVKGYVGNLGAASGAVELAASLLGYQQRLTPPTLNYAEPDPECPIAIVAEPRSPRTPYVLKVSFTQMGQCAALVVRNWEG